MQVFQVEGEGCDAVFQAVRIGKTVEGNWLLMAERSSVIEHTPKKKRVMGIHYI
jgi:hypothetical protein